MEANKTAKAKINVKYVSLEDSKIDFGKCVFCQTVTEANNIKPTGQGYTSLSRDIAKFIECTVSVLPKHLSDVFEDVAQFEDFCKNRNVVYHKRCRNEFNSRKIDRLSRQLNKTSPSESTELICIFCNKPDHLSTISSNDTVSKIISKAEFTNNALIIESLSKHSDFRNIKYHKNCYVNFFKKKNGPSTTDSGDGTVVRDGYHRVLNEIISQIEKTRHCPEQEFFKLAKSMTDRLCSLGLETCGVHSTRLKEQLLSEIEGLRADRIGREIFLFFDDSVKMLVANTIGNGPVDDDSILARAAEILTTSFFIEHLTRFSGPLNKTYCAEKTSPKQLVEFISLLLEGRGSNASKLAEKISQNIAQIILLIL